MTFLEVLGKKGLRKKMPFRKLQAVWYSQNSEVVGEGAGNC